MPFMPGISISSSTASTQIVRTSAIACSPVSASMISKFIPCRVFLNAQRIAGSSSTMRSLPFVPFSVSGDVSSGFELIPSVPQ